MSQVIKKEDLKAWLNSLIKEYSVFAPVSADGALLFKRIDNASQVAYVPGNATLGPKECLFPLSHTLLTAESAEGEMKIVPSPLDRDIVVFGLRPCDAQGFAVFDRPMLQNPADGYYKERRQRTTLVGIACNTAPPGCFCTSTAGGPHDKTHLDVMLTEIPDGFITDAITDKGKKLIQVARLTESAAKPPPPPDMPVVPTARIAETMRRVYKDQYWSRLADRCIHCNVCSYVCPTCYCFDIRDYEQEGKIQRVRSWESCEAPGFTKLAGGHDPRADKGAKLRQRFAHKLLYFPQEFDGMLACTGCGRCVRQCPVNIDIREVISDVQKIGDK